MLAPACDHLFLARNAISVSHLGFDEFEQKN